MKKLHGFFSYSKSMANFEAFRWNISSIINLLFLMSELSGLNYIIFQIACFQFHADFEQISQKMDIKIAYMARGNSTLIFAKITSLRFASGDSIFHSTGGGIWYEKILPKKISPPFLMNLFWDYSLVDWVNYLYP